MSFPGGGSLRRKLQLLFMSSFGSFYVTCFIPVFDLFLTNMCLTKPSINIHSSVSSTDRGGMAVVPPRYITHRDTLVTILAQINIILRQLNCDVLCISMNASIL